MPRRRILLTGADSLAGSHILNLLLSDNNSSVRAVVGSPERAYAIQHQHRQGTLDLTVVPEEESTVPGAFDNALSDYGDPFHTVIHTVTANPSEEADCLARFINLETTTVIGFLKSLQEVAREVKRVVIVTSLTPYARWLIDPQIERSSRGAANAIHGSTVVDPEYILATSQASDNIIHDAVLRWMRESNAPFDNVWITAPSVYGPTVGLLETSSDLIEANRRIWNICSNEHREAMESPPYGIAQFLDVRDLALASVRAAYMTHASNKRFLISAGIMPSGSEIASFLVACFPGFQGRVQTNGTPAYRSFVEDPSVPFADIHLTATILGLSQYHSAEQTLADTARQILDLQQRKDWRRIIQS
ncbi:NAD(P)-binding protein [Cucurbitaria berberidis CBS 394.84]|uniref:NAD(P)-binding protein n=1 Tax=Cucurbitaria berberidis CBS 394.84 TaxID=1168544 RepID=A0A9P4GP04_9PLEO|nr:NAD(P)-binding protein [Cucurbitaria berberidis CBS 394.84]KAF1848697.1 NAD(P)-binding protein [Cucurbitaria berberidis CBS 394.84]